MRAGLIVCAALLMVSPAQACHRFRVGIIRFRSGAPWRSNRPLWFVEIKPSPRNVQSPPLAGIRSADQREHGRHLEVAHAEMNDLMKSSLSSGSQAYKRWTSK